MTSRLLFHTGPRRMFPLVREAVASVMPLERLRYIAFSHVEADECGSLNEWLAAAPRSVPLCGKIAALVSIDDLADRPARALGDGETLSLGAHSLRWFDTPHLPHAWECGFLMEERTKTLLCGDLFTQPGTGERPLVESDILGPSEAFRRDMDYYSHTKDAARDDRKTRRRRTRRRSRACTAAPGAAMPRRSCAPSAIRSRSKPRPGFPNA